MNLAGRIVTYLDTGERAAFILTGTKPAWLTQEYLLVAIGGTFLKQRGLQKFLSLLLQFLSLLLQFLLKYLVVEVRLGRDM